MASPNAWGPQQTAMLLQPVEYAVMGLLAALIRWRWKMKYDAKPGLRHERDNLEKLG